jgi:hypothetical protein
MTDFGPKNMYHFEHPPDQLHRIFLAIFVLFRSSTSCRLKIHQICKGFHTFYTELTFSRKFGVLTENCPYTSFLSIGLINTCVWNFPIQNPRAYSTWRKVHRPELKLTEASLHKFIRQLNATLIALRYRHVLLSVCSYFFIYIFFCQKSVQQLSMSSKESKTKRCFAFIYCQCFPKSTRICPIAGYLWFFLHWEPYWKLITSCARPFR